MTKSFILNLKRFEDIYLVRYLLISLTTLLIGNKFVATSHEVSSIIFNSVIFFKKESYLKYIGRGLNNRLDLFIVNYDGNKLSIKNLFCKFGYY